MARRPRLDAVLSFVVTLTAAIAIQYAASRSRGTSLFAAALVALIAVNFVMTTSMGLLGVVPVALTLDALSWRMQLDRTRHGVLIVIACGVVVVGPFLFAQLGWMGAGYDVRDGMLVVLPRLHSFPKVGTFLTITMSTIGAMTATVVFARLFTNQLRRAEESLFFQAWQLQQLLPPT